MIETEVVTNLVKQLCEPNSGTQLVDEDDDGDQGVKATIVCVLSPEEYLVQFWPYNQLNGTSDCGIRVTKQ